MVLSSARLRPWMAAAAQPLSDTKGKVSRFHDALKAGGTIIGDTNGPCFVLAVKLFQRSPLLLHLGTRRGTFAAPKQRWKMQEQQIHVVHFHCVHVIVRQRQRVVVTGRLKALGRDPAPGYFGGEKIGRARHSSNGGGNSGKVVVVMRGID